MARNCPACAKPFRKGQRIGVMGEDRTVVVQLVCGECARRAFRIVRPIGSAASLCTVCKAQPARICSDCGRKARAELVAPILLALHGMARASQLQGDAAAERAFEHAARALEAESERG